MVLLTRIELVIYPYQGYGMPLTYKSVVPKEGFEPSTKRFAFFLLREVTLPIRPLGHNLESFPTGLNGYSASRVWTGLATKL